MTQTTPSQAVTAAYVGCAAAAGHAILKAASALGAFGVRPRSRRISLSRARAPQGLADRRLIILNMQLITRPHSGTTVAWISLVVGVHFNEYSAWMDTQDLPYVDLG